MQELFPPEAPAQLPIALRTLRTARERVRFDLPEVTERVNAELDEMGESPITVTQLSSWEHGTGGPTVAEAEALARVYLVSFVDLLQEELPLLPGLDFRRRAGNLDPLSYESLSRLEHFARLYELARRIYMLLETPEDIQIPVGGLDDDIEELAAKIREQLGLTAEEQMNWKTDLQALNCWIDKIESAGVFVFRLAMPLDDCKGASRWDRGGPPAILLNAADRAAGQLFTLLHEFAHIVYSRQDSDGTICDPSMNDLKQDERRANRLAAACLIPSVLLERLLKVRVPEANYRDWPHSVKVRLKKALGVSHAVIGIRLKELNLVADAGTQLWKKSNWTPRGPRTKRWQQYRRILGSRTRHRGSQAIRDGLMASSEIARMLDAKVTDIEQALA